MKQVATFICAVILICLDITASQALAALVWGDVTSGYDTCFLDDLGNGYSEATIWLSPNNANAASNQDSFISRAVAVYRYSESGYTENIRVQSVTMNGTPSDAEMNLSGVTYYYRNPNNSHSWSDSSDMPRVVVVRMQSHFLASWSGIAIGMGNLGSRDFVVDKKGLAYVQKNGGEGRCNIISNPLADIDITVTAPDWNLGEIKPGQQSIPLSGSAEQLCLKYTGSSVAGKQFIINATNQHGIKNNSYLMKHLLNPSQEIPYGLIMNRTVGGVVVLPNSYHGAIELNAGGSTCFIPTFITMAPENLEPGLYTDVLTFNIVTKA
ncbi:hypothetical protein [Erwinia sorbitola]|nr:hypothetical protein [Erwinia sorbitola]QGU89361.1 hypothetical protein GN242_20050 [Erwinia sorbitola]